jgi:putative SOS response-associated peptidase YedK
MCCRYLLLKEHLAVVLRELGVPPAPDFVSRYNIAPGGPIPAIRASAAGRELAPLHWGLVPAWSSGNAEGGLPNARAETLGTKRSFKEAIRRRRCLIPASGFYEWEQQRRIRLPWLFRAAGEGPFCLAGIWEQARAEDGADVASCAIVTTSANELMRPIHDRMPVIVPAESRERWLDPSADDPAEWAAIFQPADRSALTAIRVGQRVNRADQDDALCILPVSPADEPIQLHLGLS